MRRRRTDYIDSVRTLSPGRADQKIVRFDVAVNERLVMDRLYASKLYEVDQIGKTGVHGECMFHHTSCPIDAPSAVLTCTRT
jgi:hypothetical protein